VHFPTRKQFSKKRKVYGQQVQFYKGSENKKKSIAGKLYGTGARPETIQRK
jgi:hypothetical protein